MHIGYVAVIIATNANGIPEQCTRVLGWSLGFFVCCCTLCNHSSTCVRVHAHPAEIGCAHSASQTEFQLQQPLLCKKI